MQAAADKRGVEKDNVAAVAPVPPETAAYSMAVGDIIDLDHLLWRVLDIQMNWALLIAEFLFEPRAYHDAGTDTTWEHCTLRAHLNGAFYDGLSESTRSRIVEVTNQNPPNRETGARGCDPTRDNIFLLSIAQARGYFKRDADRVAKLSGEPCCWWLR